MIQKKSTQNPFVNPDRIKAFLRENHNISPAAEADNSAVYNNPDRYLLEEMKKKYALSNADIVNIMNEVAVIIFDDENAKLISLPSFQRKMNGQSNFTALEIRLLVEILNLTPIETLLAFNLFSQLDLNMYTDDDGAVHAKPVKIIRKIEKSEE